MKLSLLTLSATLGLTAAAKKNPFAPKVSANNPKAKMNAKLMGGATPLRKLEENAEVDLSSYSIKFEKCQFVKQYNDEGQGGGGKNNANTTPLITKRFVIFRLCPDTSCGSCNYNYGEYIVDMDTYLESTLGYKQEMQEQYCESCNKCIELAAQQAEQAANGEEGNGEEDENASMCANMDTSTCYSECQNIENMEANGYVDASELTGCQKLDYQDNNGNVYYAGAMCASSGARIKIGIFTDEECSIYDETKDVETYMKNGDGNSMKLSYHLLKQTFAEGECVANCLTQQDNDGDGKADIAEVCQNLYEGAGKCEKTHGFENGIYSYENYDNQVRNEGLVCDFISSLKSGAYDMTGEIVVSGGRSIMSSSAATTGGQKFALTFFILGSVGLAGYAAMLHSQLTKGAKADLSRQGGAMA